MLKTRFLQLQIIATIYVSLVNSADHEVVQYSKSMPIIDQVNSHLFPFIISDATTTKNGQIGYLATVERDYSQLIGKYDLSGQTPVYIKGYKPAELLTRFKKIIIYKEFLIAACEQQIHFINESSFQFLGKIDLEQQIFQMIAAEKKDLLVFTTKTGKFGYLLENDMLLSDPDKLVIVSSIKFNKKSKLAISSNQKYVAIYTLSSTKIKIFLTETLAESPESNLVHPGTIYSQIKGVQFSYKAGQQNVLISLAQGGARQVYRYVLSEQKKKSEVQYFENKSISYLLVNEIQLEFSAVLQEFVGVFKSLANEYFLFEIKFTKTNPAGSFTVDFSRHDNTISGTGDILFERNTRFFTLIQKQKKILFFKFNECDVSSFYNYCQKACQACSNQCSNCSAEGCGIDMINCNSKEENVFNESLPDNPDNSSLPDNSQTNQTALQNGFNESLVDNSFNESLPESLSNTNQTSLQSQQLQQQTDLTVQIIQNMLGNEIVTSFNKVPGSRNILRVFFGFFTNFDDLWLYNYHNRQYSRSVETFFQKIQALQNQKWQLIPAKNLWILLGIDLSFILKGLDFKPEFTSDRFKAVQQRSNGFFLNTIDFILSNCLLITVMFLLLKLAFEILKSYKFSLLLREYSFLLMMPIVMLEGNIQLFSYLFTYEISTMISKKHWHKFHNAHILIMSFLIIVLCIFVFFHAKQKYRKLNKYFLKNVRNTLLGTFYTIINFSIRNLLLGMAHYIFEKQYTKKIACLLVIEVTFLCASFLQLKRHRIHDSLLLSKLYFWASGVYCTFLRMMLIMIFLITNDLNDQQCLQPQNQGYAYTSNMILILYISIFIGFEIFSVITALIQLKDFLLSYRDQKTAIINTEQTIDVPKNFYEHQQGTSSVTLVKRNQALSIFKQNFNCHNFESGNYFKANLSNMQLKQFKQFNKLKALKGRVYKKRLLKTKQQNKQLKLQQSEKNQKAANQRISSLIKQGDPIFKFGLESKRKVGFIEQNISIKRFLHAIYQSTLQNNVNNVQLIALQ